MLTWQIDRIFRAGPLCALATLIMPMGMAVLVHTQRQVENVLGIVLVASGIIFIGSMIGSMWTSGFGALLFSLGAILAEVPVVLLGGVGITLYLTLMLNDLAGVFHRGPRINRTIWSDAAITAAVLSVLSAIVIAATYLIGNLATWQSIVVPFAIAAIGFSAKLAADAHRASARQLTARRSPQPDKSATGNDSSN